MTKVIFALFAALALPALPTPAHGPDVFTDCGDATAVRCATVDDYGLTVVIDGVATWRAPRCLVGVTDGPPATVAILPGCTHLYLLDSSGDESI